MACIYVSTFPFSSLDLLISQSRRVGYESLLGTEFRYISTVISCVWVPLRFFFSLWNLTRRCRLVSLPSKWNKPAISFIWPYYTFQFQQTLNLHLCLFCRVQLNQSKHTTPAFRPPYFEKEKKKSQGKTTSHSGYMSSDLALVWSSNDRILVSLAPTNAWIPRFKFDESASRTYSLKLPLCK